MASLGQREETTKESLMKKYGLNNIPTKKKKVVKKKPKPKPTLKNVIKKRKKALDKAGGF